MLLTSIEYLIFFILSVNILYLLVFSVASRYPLKSSQTSASVFKRIAILIPAYKEDQVIMECVNSCLTQDYPHQKYDTIVISDQMKDTTVSSLKTLPLKLINVVFQNSTKAKALNYAMAKIGDNYDIAVILDADNVVDSKFLSHINISMNQEGIEVTQAHRTAKNKNTKLAILDAISEEINNSIFRLGHMNTGLSAALIGSGMVFKYELLKKELYSINAIGGFDRALELTLIKKKKKITYLPNTYVWDEKIQNHHNFSKQRKRWLSAQLHYLRLSFKEIPQAIQTKNWDLCDKIFQQMSLPRVLLLGITFLIALGTSFFTWETSIKWWILFITLSITLYIAIPKQMLTTKSVTAILILPLSFILMFLNLFKLKNANKRFIHTSHGIKNLVL